MSNRYAGPSLDASYQVSVHLAEGFQRRRLKCEKLTDDGRQVKAKAYISVHCNVTVLFIVNVFTSINNLTLNYTTRSHHKLKLCSSQTAPAEP
jgi:hypothetical protein